MRSEERAETTDALTRAFRDNPATRALLDRGGTPERERALRQCLGGFVRAYEKHGRIRIVRAEGKIVAASLASAPGEYPLSLRGEMRMAAGCISAGPRNALRYARMGAHVHRLHPAYRHWYLFFLGVVPEQQGKGFGGMLLRELTSSAERDGVACYLETDKESSVRLYQRHGYGIVHEQTFPEFHDLKMWFMTRPIASSSP